jgi:CBS domain containing-hemolysin-like protein
MSGLINDLLKILLIAAVIVVHGYFVATEYSLITLRKTRIQQLAEAGNKRAILVLDTLRNLPELIAAVQLGVTMASLALGALAEPTIAEMLRPAFGFVPSSWQPLSAHTVSIALTFVIITAVDIVVAELVPKTIALQSSERIALLVIRPIRGFIWLFRPFIGLLNRAGDLVIRLAGLSRRYERSDVHSTEELKMLVTASTRAGVLDADEQEMVFRVLEFSQLAARQIMVPRTEIVAFQLDTPSEVVYEAIATSHHTRYPVYRGTIDDIAGILYVRDALLRWVTQGEAGIFDLRSLIRPAHFVPDSMHIDLLLTHMRASQVHIAVVLDEFGGTAGIVTLEDILERIVGEVRDEFEARGQEVTILPKGEAIIDGLVLVSDVNERFDLNLDAENYDTLGGLIWGELGRQPRVGDEVDVDGVTLRVEAMDGLRVASIRLIRRSRAPSEAEQASS